MITITVTTDQTMRGLETRWTWKDDKGRCCVRIYTSNDPAATDAEEARLCREIGKGEIVRVNIPGKGYAVLRDGNGYQEWVRA